MTTPTWRKVTQVNQCLNKTTEHNCDSPCYHLTCKTPVVNRNCLTQSEYSAMLSTPRGYKWTGERGLNFIVKRCEKMPPKNFDQSKLNTVPTSVTWQRFVTQFLESSKGTMHQTTQRMLTNILYSKVDFSDPKWSTSKNTQKELWNFLRNINPDCDSNKWKGDFFKSLSSLIFNNITQIICSGRPSKKKKFTRGILNKINNITQEHAILDSPDNFLQGVQIFTAKIISPWLDKPMSNFNEGSTNGLQIKSKTKNKSQNHISNKHHTVRYKRTINKKSVTIIKNKIKLKKKNKRNNHTITENLDVSKTNSQEKINKIINYEKTIKTNKKTKKSTNTNEFPNDISFKKFDNIAKQNKTIVHKGQQNVKTSTRKSIETENTKKTNKKSNNTDKFSNNLSPEKTDVATKNDKITSKKGKTTEKKGKKVKTTVKNDKTTARRSKTNGKSTLEITDKYKNEIVKEDNSITDNHVLKRERSVTKDSIKTEKQSNTSKNFKSIIRGSEKSKLNTKSILNEVTGKKSNIVIQDQTNKWSNDDKLTQNNLLDEDNKRRIDSNNSTIKIQIQPINDRENDGNNTKKIGENNIETVKTDFNVGNPRLSSTQSKKSKIGIEEQIMDENKTVTGEILNTEEQQHKDSTITKMSNIIVEQNSNSETLHKLNDTEIELLKENELKNTTSKEDDTYSDYPLLDANANKYDDRLLSDEDYERSVLDHLYNFLGTLNEECEEEAEPYDSFEATLRSNESCYKQFAKQVDKSIADKLENKIKSRSSNCDKTDCPGIVYQLCKKDGSNYSIRKTILPVIENSDPVLTALDSCDSMEKAKVVVRTIRKVNCWKCESDYQNKSIKKTSQR